MMDFDGPLDFESEDPLFVSSAPTKKRKKIIGLDDLLTDYYKDKSKLIEKESKRATASKYYSSDEDEDITRKSKQLAQLVDKCENQVQEIKTEDEIPLWGARIFGNQKTLPSLVCPELGSCKLLQSFMSNELNAVLELNSEKGETFFQGLLINGWLSKLVFTCGHVEESVANWTFNLMLYSSKEDLRESACDFWCSILQSKTEVDQPSLRIDWLPTYGEIKRALVVYGYLLDSSIDIQPISEMVEKEYDYDSEGPPPNIRCWVRFLAACCQARSTWSIFSNLEAEEFLSVIICLFLDRQLQGLSLLFYECMVSLISFFTDNEWNISREKVAKSLACRVRKDLNCLRLVECISGVDARSKHLRSEVAFQILLNCIDEKVSDGEEILRLLISINVKGKRCDFFSMYIYLVLTENWLFFSPPLEDKPFIHEMWGVYLRNCSCQITSTDMRSYASKLGKVLSKMEKLVGATN
ncbi:hypothetical protein BVC80_1835g379 [Macleaya cordata]|uniref:Uncharacterized protein n=1 Tax=Macleaya cordata TaxID=56857 RepID=A0A200R5H4_MACCD|nr:hypothetical protein BVC80_1835g379 [Macleaya cordata]